ncbi:MAG: hypothetical protein ACLFMO_03815 [Eubacteriales bacterium]
MFFVFGIILTIISLMISFLILGIKIIKITGLWVTVLYFLTVVIGFTYILKIDENETIKLFNQTVTLDECAYLGLYISIGISCLVFIRNIFKFVKSLIDK